MKPRASLFSSICAALGAAASLLLSPHANAATLTWVGSADNDWKTAANWDAGSTYPGELNNQDIAIVNLDGADVSLSGGLTYNPSSIQVTAPGSGSSTLSITAGSVATTATPANQSVLVGGSTGSSTLTVGSGASLTVGTGSGKYLQIGQVNQNASLSLLDIAGGTVSSSRLGYDGTGGSDVRVSGIATFDIGSIETRNNGGSKYGKLEFVGSQHSSTATSMETGFDGASNSSFDLLFTADAGGIKPLSISGSLTLRDDDENNRRTHLTLDLSGYTLPEDPTENVEFTLMNYGSLDGAFSSVTVLGGNYAGIDYTGGDSGQDIVIAFNSAVPEPGTLALMLLSGLTLYGAWRTAHTRPT
jgi:hypothetical protein